MNVLGRTLGSWLGGWLGFEGLLSGHPPHRCHLRDHAEHRMSIGEASLKAIYFQTIQRYKCAVALLVPELSVREMASTGLSISVGAACIVWKDFADGSLSTGVTAPHVAQTDVASRLSILEKAQGSATDAARFTLTLGDS